MSNLMTILSIVMLVLLNCDLEINAFNLSPKPNLIFQQPSTINRFHPEKGHSSYFGLTINLKRNKIIIGAPRANSTKDSQRNVNENGVIYECRFDEPHQCSELEFSFQYEFGKAHIKDNSWLGGSMDGNEWDDDVFVVCAPHLKTYNAKLVHGVCHWTYGMRKRVIMPFSAPPHKGHNFFANGTNECTHLMYKGKDICKDGYTYRNAYAEMGFSVHITENRGILIGAPGIFRWAGSVIRYNLADGSSDIPDPGLLDFQDDTYFGYAVSSGRFDGPNNPIRYVASAPKENYLNGTVSIFDIVYSNQEPTRLMIDVYKKFEGQQMGEYFGYSLITEDFDNDTYIDIAIGAPYHSFNQTFDVGAVYIYKNYGLLNFGLPIILKTDYKFSGQFGMTLSKVGDINRDGFNDLIVAAPFEGNGAIYIYHGSPNGIITKPSQKITAPETPLNQMFGYGLSKGVDIDDNGYLDVAVGSPNTDTVYIYKSYPVIRTNCIIIPLERQLKNADASFEFQVNCNYETNIDRNINFDLKMHATLKLDDNFKRSSFGERNENKLDFNSTIPFERVFSAKYTCLVEHIYNPITIEMFYDIPNDFRKSESNKYEKNFCKKCIAVDKSDALYASNEIKFDTGCRSYICMADLKLSADVFDLEYVLGTKSTLSIEYYISNQGETAYYVELNVTLPEGEAFFLKPPNNCNTTNLNSLTCSITQNIVLKNDKMFSQKLNISIDTVEPPGSELIIIANVSSNGNEQEPRDNVVTTPVRLKAYSKIDVIGYSTPDKLKYETNMSFKKVRHVFEVYNRGPSNVSSLNVYVYLPIFIIDQQEQLIDTSSVFVKSLNNGKNIDVKWNELNVQKRIISFNNYNNMIMNKYNQSRSIYFTCDTFTNVRCAEGILSLTELPIDSNFSISIDFKVDMKKVVYVMTEIKNVLVIRSEIELRQKLDEKYASMNVTQDYPYTVIFNDTVEPTPLWIYIVSGLGGILLLALFIFILYKIGFFKRSKRDELKQLKRQSEPVTSAQIVS